MGVSFGGSQCSSTAVLRGDAFLAVCGGASCNGASAALLFSNACTGLDGAFPDYWVCGTGADWSLIGPLARAHATRGQIVAVVAATVGLMH